MCDIVVGIGFGTSLAPLGLHCGESHCVILMPALHYPGPKTDVP